MASLNDFHEETRTVTSQDNTSFKIKAFSCHNKNNPVIICTPAMGMPARFYRPLAYNLIKNNINTVITDIRGVETSSVRASRSVNYGYHEMITYDWPAIIGETEKIFPHSTIFLMGHSLGGKISALYLSMQKEPIKGLIMIAVPSIYYKCWGVKGFYKTIIATQLAYFTSIFFGYFPGDKLGVLGRESRGVVRDWSRQAITGKYNVKNNDNDFEKSLAEMKCPVLAISLDGDEFAPKPAVKHLLKKMKKAQKTHLHLNPHDFNLKNFNHFNWVRRSAPIARLIKDWVDEV